MDQHANVPQRKYFKVGVNLHGYGAKDLKELSQSICTTLDKLHSNYNLI